jgi:hypothetical protein
MLTPFPPENPIVGDTVVVMAVPTHQHMPEFQDGWQATPENSVDRLLTGRVLVRVQNGDPFFPFTELGGPSGERRTR